jgi:hypothetical protein
MKAKRKLSIFDIGGLPVQPHEQPIQQVDPRLEKLKTRAAELLVINETAEREAEVRRQQAIAAAREQRVEAVRKQCRTSYEWDDVLNCVETCKFTEDDKQSGRAFEIALGIVRGES